jgi:sugar phosphate isomerase/epimerase
MLRLAAFADEIAPALDIQFEHCLSNGVRAIELRGVDNINVLDFDDTLLARIKAALAARGMTIACIGSPIGKIRIDEPFAPHFERFKHAVALAEFFNAPFVRIFSYYPAQGETQRDLITKHRDEVMRRMRAKAEYAAAHAPVLVHENEANIFGEHPAECLDLLQTVNSPKLKAAFDFANFVVAKDDPLPAWHLLKSQVVHIHVKDALMADGKIVPAGQGDGRIPEILREAYASGYRGFLTLEPHLAVAGQFQGFTGPQLFASAVTALKTVCTAQKIPLG